MAVGVGTRDAWHGVQFYDDDAQLCASVGDYLGAGLRAGDSLLVVSTPAHRVAFEDKLCRDGHDVETALARGQLVIFDARETLSRIVRNGKPNVRLFRATIEPLLACARTRNGRVRIYGEMVDLLWSDGDRRGAILLEQLWNDVHEPASFWLLCGYKREPGFVAGMDDVCSLHTHVIDMPRAPLKPN